MTRVAIIIPVLNEAATLDAALAPLRGLDAEVIVIDGGSTDSTVERTRANARTVIAAPRGRARQMNAGADCSAADVLLFLHADTRLPANALTLIRDGLTTSGRVWGRFDVAIDGTHALLPLIARLMNLRSRLTGIATGDQAIFVTREAFRRVGGFPPIALMEDIALSRALKRLTPPLCLRARACTSGRRWERNGVVRTIVLMWRLRLAYFLGADPATLARRYGYAIPDA
jgi:rSAM/selenodomain-associated transferase 2